MGTLSGLFRSDWLAALRGGGVTRSAYLNKRRHARYSVTGVRCALGEIVNISMSGVCVRCVQRVRVPRGKAIRLYLRSGNQQIQVDAVLMRQRRRGLRIVELGFAFVDITPSLVAAVESLGRFGFIAKPRGRSADTPEGGPAATVECDVPDYYKTLGLRADATTEQVHEAFRTLARKYHPDLNKDPSAAERFMVVRQAYQVLRQERSRREYDAMLSLAASERAATRPPRK